jgi:GntR family transcriptional regulator, transcriptional repressor for pyruvate dehydrogenase complex
VQDAHVTDVLSAQLPSPAKRYASIVERILDGIASGAFPSGSALPAERALAGELGVGRGSVREAIRVLEHAGILEVRSGSGTYVVDTGPPKVAVFRAHAALTGEHSPFDVIAARHAVEPACAALAATHRHERDLEVARETVDRQADLLRAGHDTAAADLDFHLAVAAATHNPVLLLLVERIVEIMRRPPWSDLKHASRAEPSGGERDVAEHHAVLDAIERHDATAAAATMADHLSSVEGDLLAQVE